VVVVIAEVVIVGVVVVVVVVAVGVDAMLADQVELLLLAVPEHEGHESSHAGSERVTLMMGVREMVGVRERRRMGG
jgi:hypothetical protein